MSEKPRVSVVMSVFNGEYFLREAMDEAFLKYFAESVRTRDRGDAVRMWCQSFRLSPRKGKIRILLEGLLSTREAGGHSK